MSEEGMVFKSSEASKGAFQGIKMLRGLLVDIDRVAGKVFEGQEGKTPKDQAQIKLEDVAILEMEEGEEEPELKEGKFTIWMPYAQPGKKPHKNSLWIKGFVASAEKLGKTPIEFKGEYITLAREPIHLFTNEAGESVDYDCWVFAEDEASAGSGDILGHVQKLIIGNNKSTAMRNLLTNARAKQYPEYRQAITNGTHEEELGVVLVDGKYQAKET